MIPTTRGRHAASRTTNVAARSFLNTSNAITLGLLLWGTVIQDRRVVGLVLSWTTPFYYRVYVHEPTSTQDGLLFLALGLWNYGATLWDKLVAIIGEGGINTTYLSFGILGALLVLRGLIVLREPNLRDGMEENTTKAPDPEFLKPMLLRSKTTHSRAFPQKHSFSYSYLFVGTPVDYQGRAGSILSVDVERKKGWFDIQASDYLDRGGTGVGLRGKLEAYLRSQGVEERRYPYGYFVTAPRFLGYSFNPVSFWYLYDQNKALKAMVLEVNNTFDERRMYLLHATDAEDSASSRADSSQNGDATSDVVAHAEKRARPHAVKFTNAWEKDFHVSPFNSRKGTYTLVAHDPFYSKNGTQHVIDNTIVLKSSKQHAKLVAQVFSDGIPLDPKSLSRWDTFRFVISWWWVGLVTFPRIVKEAYKLYFKRKLHVWFRPEVTLSSIRRNATDTEKVLEGFYQQYFADLVYSATVPIQLSYTPSSGLGDARVFISQSSMIHHDTLVPCLNIKILSPAFYSRFVHYAHTSEAFDRECLCTDEKNQTVSVSDARLLNNLLSTGKPPVSAALPTYLFDGLRWDMMRRLRCPPAAPAYPPPLISDANTAVKDIRSLALSPVDRFVRDHCADAWLYRRKVTELFLAQRFAFGFTVVVGAADLLFRLLLICLAQYWLAGGPQSEASRAGHGTYSVIAARAVDLVVVNMVHVWAFAKGF